MSAFCVSCNKNVEGRLTEMVVLDSGNWLYRGECPDCYYEIKRIIPKNISGSYNGRRVVSETNNEGPIPSPEALN
jgi:arginyl-tRNA--protein-N-Asp/Glu arginylyltransferase